MKEMGEQYETFDDFGHGSFLHYINADNKFKEIVDNALGVATGNSGRRLVTRKEVGDFVGQCAESAQVVSTRIMVWRGLLGPSF